MIAFCQKVCRELGSLIKGFVLTFSFFKLCFLIKNLNENFMFQHFDLIKFFLHQASWTVGD